MVDVDYEFTDLGGPILAAPLTNDGPFMAELPLAGPLTDDERTDTLILEQAVGVVSSWLLTHYSPHAMMIITTDSAEILEGRERFSVSHPMMPTPVMPDHLG